MRSIFIAVVVLFAFGCTNEQVGSVSAAETSIQCQVDADGSFPTGEEFEGHASDVDGIESIDWRHVTADDLIFLSHAATISCNIDDSGLNADFFGSGTATFDGNPDYSYIIYVQDNRPATQECTCEGDADRGHGNDEDCTDEDNPGSSTGCHRSDEGAAHANTHPDECTCVWIPDPGLPADVYQIEIFAPDGSPAYSFSGSVETGDVSIVEVL